MAAAGATLGPGWADSRVALVVGNSRYINTPMLENPGNDAADVGAALEALGFKVTLRVDATKRQFDQSLAQFSRDAKTADAALFFYAGHGMQFQGSNYLMPIDAELRDEFSLRYEMTRVDEVKDALGVSKGVKILVLDSCRDNPLANRLVRSIVATTRESSRVQGFTRLERTDGMVIVFSTQADEVARDGVGRNSPFSAAFLKELKEPGLEVGALFRRVESDVFKATDGLQSPELSISMVPEYYLNQSETDQEVWASVRANADADKLKGFLARFPKSFYAPDAAARLSLIESQSRKTEEAERVAAALQTAVGEAARLKARQGDLDNAERAARGREQELSARLAAAEAERARLGEELTKSSQEQAALEHEVKRRATQDEQLRSQKEAELRAEMDRLTADDAEKRRLLQKALDEDAAGIASNRQVAQRAEQAAKDAADAKTKAADAQAQELRRRIAQLEADAATARADADREASKAADGRKASDMAQHQLAAVAPAASAPALEQPPTAGALTPQIRAELRRLGCYTGADFGWDSPAIQLSVAKYLRYASLANAAPAPDEILLEGMKKQPSGFCPPECSVREIAVGGRCVVKTCPAGASLTRSGVCAKRPAPVQRELSELRSPHVKSETQAPVHVRPHSRATDGGRCFSFNGSQYCE